MTKSSVAFLNNKFLLFNIFWALLSGLVYFSVEISPADIWLAGFIAWTIPFFIFGHICFFLYWLLFQKMYALISLASLLLGFKFLEATFALNFNQIPPTKTNHFKVLSYNVKVFNVYQHWKEENNSFATYLIDWVAEQEADIRCLQEFYHNPTSDVFNTLQKIAFAQNYGFYATPIEDVQRESGFFGVIIFSKLPIVGSGDVPLGDKPHQKGIFADIKIGRDTIRVFNVHLRSMSIDEKALFQEEKNENETQMLLLDLFQRLRKGFIDRASQVQILESYVLRSPHPVIVCGDFNDLPYSYTYQYLKKNLKNAFEEAGNGFGFSYNGYLFFLRIDNQFYEHIFQLHSFKTYQNVPYSDHFPILAEYSLRKK